VIPPVPLFSVEFKLTSQMRRSGLRRACKLFVTRLSEISDNYRAERLQRENIPPRNLPAFVLKRYAEAEVFVSNSTIRGQFVGAVSEYNSLSLRVAQRSERVR